MSNIIKNNRNSNFELLRIIAMLAIVSGHVAAQAFDRNVLSENYNNILYICGSGSRIAVNLFVLVGCWFMVDLDFKIERIVKLYSGLWFYSVVITLVLIFFQYNVSIIDFISSFFPFLRRRMWFVPQYISLLLISPFLKILFHRMDKNISIRFILILFFLVSLISSVRSFEDTWLGGLVWFVFLYFIIAHFKKYGFRYKLKKEFCLFLGIIIYLILVVGLIIFHSQKNCFFSMAYTLFRQYLGDYKSIPNFLCSFLIFVFFKELDIGQKRWINEISKNTLDVYMIHQQDVFIPVIWTGLFQTREWQQSKYFIFLYIITILLTFLGASIIGRIRGCFITPVWENSKLYRWICEVLKKFYNPILENEDYL